MSNQITIPVQLRVLSGGRDAITIDLASTVTQDRRTLRLLLDLLDGECPGTKARLLDAEGRLNRFISIYVDSQDARVLIEDQRKRSPGGAVPDGEDVKLNPLDLRLTGYEEIAILPAIAGG